MDSKHHHQDSLPDETTSSNTSNSLHRLETPPPQYSDLAPPPPRVFAAASHHQQQFQVPSRVTGESHQTSALEHTVSGDTDNARRPSFDPQDPATWRGSKWAEIKQQWKERHQGPREPKDPWTGRGQFTGLTPEELKAKCESYGTLLPKGQRRK